jgi:TatD DNase family protein
MILYTDSHAHLSSREMLPQIDAVMSRAKMAGVEHVVNICTDLETLAAGLEIAKKWPSIRNAGSTTPHEALEWGEEHFPYFEREARAGNLCAIGETGLDYHYERSPKEAQQRCLIRYLELAAECNLPLIFHCREAFGDLFKLVPPKCKAVLHCFTGDIEEAEECVNRGWMVSLSGIVTFKKSEKLRSVVKKIPLKQLLIETDSPFLAPQSRRGKMNEPAFLPETAACIAFERGLSIEELAHITKENAARFFAF